MTTQIKQLSTAIQEQKAKMQRLNARLDRLNQSDANALVECALNNQPPPDTQEERTAILSDLATTEKTLVALNNKYQPLKRQYEQQQATKRQAEQATKRADLTRRVNQQIETLKISVVEDLARLSLLINFQSDHPVIKTRQGAAALIQNEAFNQAFASVSIEELLTHG